ncbi:hypothetical protein C8J57DRAFT_1422966 [Mycena rebaudengoi]|nr:hypothetical protein C8J57DRAFT_1422966 [Mycena rebaudengoi]
METEVDSELCQRSTDVWFEDGTVVLKAGMTLFRVYRGILAAQSPIFQDTFAIPQPETQEMYDNCPLLVLHDSAEDLKIYLAATHDAKYLKQHPVDGIETLSALLRLSTKYETDYLRDEMISILTAIYPASLDAWVSRSPPAGYQERPADDFIALNLARDHQVGPALPGIFLECARHPSRTILRAHIPASDRDSCFDARDLFPRQIAPAYRFLHITALGCDNNDRCREIRLAWLHVNSHLLSIDELFMGDFYWDSLKCCEPCMMVSRAAFTAARIELWESLPGIFSLPPWPQLTIPK